MNDNDANRRWLMLALCFATRVGLGFQFQTLGSVADPLAREMHFSFSEIGTLIGLVQMLGVLDTPSRIGPGMALALLTTLYGAVLAHLVLLPLAARASAAETGRGRP